MQKVPANVVNVFCKNILKNRKKNYIMYNVCDCDSFTYRKKCTDIKHKIIKRGLENDITWQKHQNFYRKFKS